MNDEAAQAAAEQARQEREAVLVSSRIEELFESPLTGRFDVEHLKAVHSYIFQDLPEHRPGVIRERTEDAWVKHRGLEGQSGGYKVYYANTDIEAKITQALKRLGGLDAIKGQPADVVTVRLATLYGDLDHAHGFYEGNSRTLREFTRQLASEACYSLDWVKTGVGTKERNQLYVARDLAVFERAFPGLTEDKAMKTADRAEYEAWFDIERLRGAVGSKTLEAIIRGGLSPQLSRDLGRSDGKGWER